MTAPAWWPRPPPNRLTGPVGPSSKASCSITCGAGSSELKSAPPGRAWLAAPRRPGPGDRPAAAPACRSSPRRSDVVPGDPRSGGARGVAGRRHQALIGLERTRPGLVGRSERPDRAAGREAPEGAGQRRRAWTKTWSARCFFSGSCRRARRAGPSCRFRPAVGNAGKRCAKRPGALRKSCRPKRSSSCERSPSE